MIGHTKLMSGNTVEVIGNKKSISRHLKFVPGQAVEYIQTQKINLRTFKIHVWTYNHVCLEIKNEWPDIQD